MFQFNSGRIRTAGFAFRYASRASRRKISNAMIGGMNPRFAINDPTSESGIGIWTAAVITLDVRFTIGLKSGELATWRAHRLNTTNARSILVGMPISHPAADISRYSSSSDKKRQPTCWTALPTLRQLWHDTKRRLQLE